jgi:WD40 repeat protein
MPALIHNRLRLKRLNGTQALEIVSRPAPHLLAAGVAEKIVEFVAGGRGGSVERLAELDVEPPLLSVICRELNERRQALGQAQITADLVSGNRREILTDFYNRCVADLPAAMRTFVEDRLLTKSGFRDNLALETALEEPGVTRPLVDTLVFRRLLRIEDRLGVQRVELTHDVLAEVIRASRDARLQRLALAEAQAREQQALAEAARRSRRQRWVIAGLAAAVGALAIGAVFGIRAQRLAERAARDEAARSSRTDLSYGSQLLEQGKVTEGIAYLARAARTDPHNYAAGPRLISALAYRPFALPLAPTLRDDESALILGTSQDGTALATANESRTALTFWDTAKGIRLAGPLKSNAEILGFALATDGERIATSLVDGTIWVWETKTGKRILGPISSGPSTIRLAFSPDGRWLAAGNNLGSAHVWDARTGELQSKLALRGWVSSVHFSPDSRQLVTTVFLRGWQVWSVPDGRPVTPFNTDVHRQANLARFSPDGKHVAVCDFAGAELWDWAAGRKVGQRMHHDSRSDFAEFSGDGKLLVTISATDRITKIWEVPGGRLHRQFNFAGSVALNRDHTRLLCTTPDGAILLMDIATGRPVVEPIRSATFTTAVFSPDETTLWAAARDGAIRRFRANATAIAPLRITRNQRFSGLSWEDPQRISFRTSAKTEQLDALTGKLLSETSEWTHPSRETLQSFAPSPDRRFRASIGRDGQLELWDLRQPEAPRRHELGKASALSSLNSLIFSPDSRRLAVAAITSPIVQVWETASGRPLGEPFKAPGGSVSVIAFDPTGERLAAGDTDGNVVCWDLTSRRQLGETIKHAGQVRGIAFSPDGAKMISGGMGNLVHLVETATGRPLQPPLRLPASASVFRFSRDGRWVTIPTQSDNRIHTWDTETGARRTVELNNERPVSRISFDDESTRTAISDLIEGTLRIWSTSTGQLLTEPIRPDGTPLHVALSPDGARLAFAPQGMGTPEIWPLPVAPAHSPVPGWMWRLATAAVGGAIDSSGVLRAVPSDPAALAALAAELATLPDDSPYVRWGRWLLADPTQRSISPESPLSPADAASLFAANRVGQLVTRAVRLRQQDNRTEAELVERQIVEVAPSLADHEADFALFGLDELLLTQLAAERRYVEMEPLARAAVQLREKHAGSGRPSLDSLRGHLGASLAGQGRFAEAEPHLLAACTTLSGNSIGPIQLRVAEMSRWLAQGYEAAGQPEKAAAWRKSGQRPPD